MERSSWGYHLLAFVIVAIWGSTFVFTKLLLQASLSPAHIFTLRFTIAYLLLLFTPTKFHSDSWKDELLMVALGLTGGSLSEEITVWFLMGSALILTGMYMSDHYAIKKLKVSKINNIHILKRSEK